MDWLNKIQGNLQAMINSGRIKPETASKLEQFAVEQKQKLQSVAGLSAAPTIQKNKDESSGANALGQKLGEQGKELMNPMEQMQTTANLGNYGEQLGAAFPSAQAAPTLAMPELGASSMASSGSMLGLGSLMTSDKDAKTDIKNANEDIDNFLKALSRRK